MLYHTILYKYRPVVSEIANISPIDRGKHCSMACRLYYIPIYEWRWRRIDVRYCCHWIDLHPCRRRATFATSSRTAANIASIIYVCSYSLWSSLYAERGSSLRRFVSLSSDWCFLYFLLLHFRVVMRNANGPNNRVAWRKAFPRVAHVLAILYDQALHS